MAQNTFDIFYLSSSLLSSAFHLFGIVLVCRMTMTASNQKLLITNLSSTELLYSLIMSTQTILKMLCLDRHVIFVIFYWIVLLISFAANKLMMLYLILDRLADIYLHMRYPLFITKARVVKILVALWMLAFIYGAIISVLSFSENNFLNSFHGESDYIQSYNYVMLAIDTTITIVAVTTYLYFYSKVSSIVKRTRSQGKQIKDMNRNYRKKFLIPFLMVATYLAFNVISTVLFTVRRQSVTLDKHSNELLLDIGRIFVMVGFVSDAVLYIFLQKSVRKSITSFWSKICTCRPERISPRTKAI